ncbi:hypothetical protein Cantr_05135 [Candida viswanathii]|uniref:F-box protein YDR306C n=1 Tax=Candida viswanathii TaxID=5486 RepID=A0A367XUI9_9ASCO|nr:hypothetical protein Cantr_05135 [Candida viswanathii]
MANKRRPKKIRAPYKRYVYKSNNFVANSDDEEDQIHNDDELESTLQATNNARFKGAVNIQSIYVLSDQVNYAGKMWPWSKFEKTDVLQCALQGHNPAYKQMITEQQNMGDHMVFPVEIFVRIFEILNDWGKLKPKFMRVCKLFYLIILPMIYKHPRLKATNFFNFVDSMANNKALGGYIRSLDLSYIIQSGKNAFVAKLLKRTGKNLQEFVAPQTSFGIGPMYALKNCENLQVLDLRLVSETLNLGELFKSIRNLKQLTLLSFPRSSIEIHDYGEIKWPPKLTFLRLSGGISDDFLYHLELPELITCLEFAHCPAISDLGFRQVLFRVGANLKTLKVQYPMPGLKRDSLDQVFIYCPNLTVLEITVDYVSSMFFDEQYLGYTDKPRPLRTLYVSSSGMLGTLSRLDPIDLAVALNDGRLPNLKHMLCTAKLGWNPDSDAIGYIADELDERHGGLYIGY